MRSIKVTFRAVFRQPIGLLNPMGVKIAGPQPVEIFGEGERWKAREIASPRHVVYDRLGRFVSLGHAKSTVESSFEERLESWQMWGKGPNDANEKLLTAYEVADMGDGKFGWIQEEDRTHIIHAPTIPPGARIPPAACGIMVNAKCFINNRANVRPSCRECAVIWEREYKDK
jgi:hypothetical protein